MLLEHALLASGDIAEAGAVYAGWPAHQLEQRRPSVADTNADSAEIEEITEVPFDKEKMNEKDSKSSSSD